MFPRLTWRVLKHPPKYTLGDGGAKCVSQTLCALATYPDQAGSDPGSGLDINPAPPEHRWGLLISQYKRNVKSAQLFGSNNRKLLKALLVTSHYLWKSP
jgi:hypothetical protein